MKTIKSLMLATIFVSCLLTSTAAKANSIWSNLLSGISLLDDIFVKVGYSLFGSDSVSRLAQELQVNPLLIQSLLNQGYSNGQIYYLLNLQKNTGMPFQRMLDLRSSSGIPLSFLPYYISRENPRVVFVPIQEKSIRHDNGLHLGQYKDHGNDSQSGHGNKGHGKDKD